MYDYWMIIPAVTFTVVLYSISFRNKSLLLNELIITENFLSD